MDRPQNVVLIMADQLKATALGMYSEYGIQTPNLERLASQGVVYDHAFTPHPLCVPARISLWTGRYPHAHGGRRNETPMPVDAQHAFKTWKTDGYATALIGKNHCFTEDDLPYFDEWYEISHGGVPGNALSKGTEWYRLDEGIRRAHETRRQFKREGELPRGWVTSYPLEDYSSGLIAGQTERYLESRGNEPFALWVSFPDPHEPYEVPEQFFELVPENVELPPWDAKALDNVPERNRVLDQMLRFPEEEIETLKHTVRVYLAMTLFVDHAVGRILDALERNGLVDNTTVVFCSDHGDFAGERRKCVKGGVFFDCLTRVPLIVSQPGTLPRGVRDHSMVNLVDIVPTLFALQGRDQLPSFQGQPLPSVTDWEPRAATFSEYGAGGPPFSKADLDAMNIPMGYTALMPSLQWREAEGRRKMVRTPQWKYTFDPMDGVDELYDMENDPWELTNLAADPAHTGTIGTMKDLLLRWSIETEGDTPVPLPDSG